MKTNPGSAFRVHIGTGTEQILHHEEVPYSGRDVERVTIPLDGLWDANTIGPVTQGSRTVLIVVEGIGMMRTFKTVTCPYQTPRD
jgi:hypothetical protein